MLNSGMGADIHFFFLFPKFSFSQKFFKKQGIHAHNGTPADQKRPK